MAWVEPSKVYYVHRRNGQVHGPYHDRQWAEHLADEITKHENAALTPNTQLANTNDVNTSKGSTP